MPGPPNTHHANLWVKDIDNKIVHFSELIKEAVSTSLGDPLIASFDNPSKNDAFGRQRISSPFTLFDSKQIFDNLPLFWDDQEVSGVGTNSVWSKDRASSTISVGSSAGRRLRQTFSRFNYQPGKSQKIEMTFSNILALAGNVKRVGMYDDENGVYLENLEGVLSLGIRSKASGSVVDTKVSQDNWNIDKFDGTGPSGITLDPTQSQIFFFDFEWLGSGTVAYGFIADRKRYYVHFSNHANVLDKVYMSTPNLPLRYEIENLGSGLDDSFESICSSVMSEGGQEDTGKLRYNSTSGIHLHATSANVLYPLIGIRLKSTHIGSAIKLVSYSAIAKTNDDFEVVFVWNPNVSGVFTYNDEVDSSVQIAIGGGDNLVTDGLRLEGIVSRAQSPAASPLNNSLSLGSAIDGTRDELVMCVRPFSGQANIEASLVRRELN